MGKVELKDGELLREVVISLFGSLNEKGRITRLLIQNNNLDLNSADTQVRLNRVIAEHIVDMQYAKLQPTYKVGDSFLHCAVKAQNIDAVTAMISAGANINAKNRDDETPAESALCLRNKDIQLILAKANAKVAVEPMKELMGDGRNTPTSVIDGPTTPTSRSRSSSHSV